MPEQIRFRTLVNEDFIFRGFIAKQPKLTVVHHTPPWRLFVQKEQGGRWAKVDLDSYTKAYRQMQLRLPDVWDMAIHCKPQHFAPPMVNYKGRPVPASMPEEHYWCSLCRRPTVMRGFRNHPALSTSMHDPTEARCTVCGMRRLQMKNYLSPMAWPPVQKN